MKMWPPKKSIYGDPWDLVIKQNPPFMGLKLEQCLHLPRIDSPSW